MKSLTLVRRIAARPSIVFEAMTTAEGVAAWFGPDDLPVVRAEMDPRVGGAYRVHFRSLDGQDGHDHEACGEFLELVPPRRIVMSWSWAFGGVPEERGRTSRIEIDLTPSGDTTVLTFTHTDLWNETSQKSHTGGWTGALNKLVRHVEDAAATTDRDRESTHGEVETRHASSSTKENGT
jgi:uncharacterized protein YndB with AHSA1/START domain